MSETDDGTEQPVEADDSSAWESEGSEATPAEGRTDSRVDVDAVLTYLMWGALVGLGILAAVATAGLYGSLSAIIDVWVARRYQPFARSALNFAVLCVAAAGIVTIAQRLRRS